MFPESLMRKIRAWKKTRQFEEMLATNGAEGGVEKLLEQSLSEGLYAGAVFGIAAFFFGTGFFAQTAAVAAGILAPLCARVFYNYFLFDNRRRKIERLTPDFLLEASLFPKGTTLAEIIETFSESNYAFLSMEFRKALQEINKGATPELALSNAKKRVKSRAFSRAIDLVVEGAKSGADAGAVFKEAAEDQLETNALIRERNSSLVIEKYTLIFAGGVIVPLVLGTVAGMLEQLDFSGLSEIGIGLSPAEKTDLLWAGKTAGFIYIIEYALIASFFLAFQEHDRKKTIVYAAFLLPVSLAVYFFAQLM
ncbi:MAG: type II secretion system F family protein [Candidatus Diapherotrites archaeon]|nr:type II secretion system F family protein [Candidatus Diapherotrites archaeon]